MAVNIPASAVRQPQDVDTHDDADTDRFSIRFKAPYADLKTAKEAFAQGDEYDGRILRNWQLERIAGNWGMLTLGLAPKDSSTEGGSVQPYKTTWSVKSVRNDKSILAYCGESEGNNPYRAHIELWMKETDQDLIEADKYTDGKGEEHTLTSLDKLITAKLKKGIESVIRFYPLVTRKKFYHADPRDSLAKLGYIDPLPNGAPSVTGSYEWLKVQDDKDEQMDGDFVRIESWMGALAAEGGWDQDLYGQNRWPMPKGNS